MFELGDDEWAVVEIKKGDVRGELVRGVFQAIKYRALLRAELGKGTVYAYLVAYSIPDEIRRLAQDQRVLWRVAANV